MEEIHGEEQWTVISLAMSYKDLSSTYPFSIPDLIEHG